MASIIGKNLIVKLSGTSHSDYITVEIEGLKIGETFSKFDLDFLLSRRRPNGDLTTERIENDEITWEGVEFDYETYEVVSNTVVAKIRNDNYDSSSYSKFTITPRPGHADYPAIIKDGEDVDINGGGRFSGRLTVGLTVAGGIALQILERRGIHISSEILEIGTKRTKEEYLKAVKEAKEDKDSVGGIIKVTVEGVKAGEIGDSYFDGLESKISNAIFGIPAIKGISFGAGFRASRMRGSEHNDEYTFNSRGKVETVTNNHGGILGGISTGMPIYYTVSVKPTPSIGRAQNTVNLRTKEDEIIEIKGRHDPCIALRMPPILEAVTALVILDELIPKKELVEEKEIEEEYLEPTSYEDSVLVEEYEEVEDENFEEDTLESLRDKIDIENVNILSAFERRLDLAKRVAKVKEKEGVPIEDSLREKEVLENIRKSSEIEYTEKNVELFKTIIELTKSKESEEIEEEKDEIDFAEPLEDEISETAYGLLGANISSSMSPFIHNRIGKLTGNTYEYKLFEKDMDEALDFIEDRNFEGLNVTMPYKRDAISYMDELTDLAEEIGAINTIIKRDDKLIGDNTDYYGFIHAIKTRGIVIKGKSCLILGNGGASDSIYLALKDMGATKITRLSHNDLNKHKQDEYIDYSVVINTTPVGQGYLEGESLINISDFINLKLVIDINYSPLKTKLIQDAKLERIKTLTGLDMLVTQAICSYEDFMDIELENETREEYIRKIRRDILLDKNIILIGMPGSGKTTVGKRLSEVLGKEFYDTDEMVEYREGMSPSEIIKMKGEAYFREREREACIVLSQVKGAVISTGGGTILDDRNFYQITGDGIVIYLKKDLNLLDTMDRPLSRDLLNMYSKRTIHYDTWKDMDVHCEYREVDEIVDEIIERIDI